MLKIAESPNKQSNFFQKFDGRVKRVPRLGIKAVLLREEFDQDWAMKMASRGSDSSFLAREKSTQHLKANPSHKIEPLQLKLRLDEATPEAVSKSKLLQRYPSERLPLIHRSEERSKDSKQASGLREKMKSEEMRMESPGEEKYRGWKYPPRLSEKALRFFVFTERGGQKSARK